MSISKNAKSIRQSQSFDHWKREFPTERKIFSDFSEAQNSRMEKVETYVTYLESVYTLST